MKDLLCQRKYKTRLFVMLNVLLMLFLSTIGRINYIRHKKWVKENQWKNMLENSNEKLNLIFLLQRLSFLSLKFWIEIRVNPLEFGSFLIIQVNKLILHEKLFVVFKRRYNILNILYPWNFTRILIKNLNL